MANDLIAQNIQKQLALNSGDIAITNNNGSYQYINTRTGQQIASANSATNTIASQAGSTATTNMQTQIYNYAKGVFANGNTPPDLVELMANLATFYCSNTGVSPQSIFKNGQLNANFLATINNLRSASSQMGFSTVVTVPNWSNNIILGPSINVALED